MRIIAGKYRGKKLYSPLDDAVRPTTDRIKETIFNIIQMRTYGASVLDLFAGSGALGIEAISREANDVTFIDKRKESIDLINDNLKGIEGNYKVITADFLTFLRTTKKKYDIIFIDPPFKSPLGHLALDAIFDLDLLESDGIIIYEHGTNFPYTLDRKGYGTRTKVMGQVTVDFITRQSRCLVTGSFDPFTIGHLKLVEKAKEKYDNVVVGLLVNEEKKYEFTPEERVEIAQEAVQDLRGVSVLYSEDMAVDVAKKVGADAIVRGVRNDQDLKYEEEMKAYNLEHGGINTEFIEIDEYKEVSSTLVREQIKEKNFENIPIQARRKVKEILHRKENGEN